MAHTFKRSIGALTAALILCLAAREARGQDVPPDRKLALGVKLGFIPPVLAVPEILVRPLPGVGLGVFGIMTSSGLGEGGRRLSLGGELIFDIRSGQRSGPYAAVAYGYYHADADAGGFYETSTSLYFTGGYTVKKRTFELAFGAGIVVQLSDEVPPCSGFFCGQVIAAPPALPALELALRWAVL
jgi:hypothetical protein